MARVPRFDTVKSIREIVNDPVKRLTWTLRFEATNGSGETYQLHPKKLSGLNSQSVERQQIGLTFEHEGILYGVRAAYVPLLSTFSRGDIKDESMAVGGTYESLHRVIGLPQKLQ